METVLGTKATTVSPEIYLRRVNLLITRGGNIIFNCGDSQSFTLTHDFSQGDVVTTRATSYAGQSLDFYLQDPAIIKLAEETGEKACYLLIYQSDNRI